MANTNIHSGFTPIGDISGVVLLTMSGVVALNAVTGTYDLVSGVSLIFTSGILTGVA